MAVLKRKRGVSKYEFEHTFSELYAYSRDRTIRVAKRKQKWLCHNIDSPMNDMFNTIMELNDGRFFSDKPNEEKLSLIRELLNQLYALEKPLMILWNIEQYETKKMVNWTEYVNKEINLLNMMSKSENKPRYITILDWHKIHETTFLSKMSELHRYVHSKVIHAKNCYDNTNAALLIKLADDAFYSLIVANYKIPTTQTEYKKRRENISKAISSLIKMNRPIIFYFNVMGYSEHIMREWSDLVTSELKMLYALQKSDRTRFSDLSD